MVRLSRTMAAVQARAGSGCCLSLTLIVIVMTLSAVSAYASSSQTFSLVVKHWNTTLPAHIFDHINAGYAVSTYGGPGSGSAADGGVMMLGHYVMRDVMFYDVAHDAWHSLPKTLSCRYWAAAARVASSKLYHDVGNQHEANASSFVVVVGGGLDKDTGDMDSVEWWNGTTWSAAAGKLSEPRSLPVTAVLGSLVFFAGGLQRGGLDISTAVDVFDAATGEWQFAPYLSHVCFNLAAAASERYGVIAFVGDQGEPNTVIDYYNVTAQSITSNSTLYCLSAARKFVAAIGSDRLLFFAGGHNSTIFDIVDVVDVVSGVQRVEHLSAPRYNIATAASGTRVVFAGGVGVNSAQPDDSASSVVDVYDVRAQAWTVLQLSSRRFNMKAASVTLADASSTPVLVFIGGSRNHSKSAPYEVDLFAFQ